MATVIISAQFIAGENIFAMAVEALLKGMGCKVGTILGDTGQDGANITIMANQTDKDAVLPPIPSSTVPENTPEITPEETEITVAMPAADTIAVSANPEPAEPKEPEATNPISGKVALKNLSSVCTVPFVVDPLTHVSTLRVKDLSTSENQVSFSYCSMVFKVMAERPGMSVCNANPEYTETSIRSMVEFVDAEADLQPVLFKLVNAPDSECSVVFGNDMACLVAQIMEKSSSDKLSTK